MEVDVEVEAKAEAEAEGVQIRRCLYQGVGALSCTCLERINIARPWWLILHR